MKWKKENLCSLIKSLSVSMESINIHNLIFYCLYKTIIEQRWILFFTIRRQSLLFHSSRRNLNINLWGGRKKKICLLVIKNCYLLRWIIKKGWVLISYTFIYAIEFSIFTVIFLYYYIDKTFWWIIHRNVSIVKYFIALTLGFVR